MTSIFHEYVNKVQLANSDTLQALMPQWLETLRASLLADQEKPVAERAINSTYYIRKSLTTFGSSSEAVQITPLQLAMQLTSRCLMASPVHYDCMQELISLYLQYSDFSVVGEYGHALNYASMYCSCGVETFRVIIARNPELVSIASPEGSYPLTTAACYDKQGDCLRVLLNEGQADPNQKNLGNSQFTPLHQAVHATNIAAVGILLEYHADRNATDKYGRKPTETGHHYSSGLAEPYRSKPEYRDIQESHAAEKAKSDVKFEEIKSLIANFSQDQLEASSLSLS